MSNTEIALWVIFAIFAFIIVRWIFRKSNGRNGFDFPDFGDFGGD